MNNRNSFTRKYIICLILSTICLSTLYGQRRGDTEPFKDRLWYGGSIGLAFSSVNLGAGYTGNEFYFGITPMAGYKVTEKLSFGPRLELNFLSGRYRQNGGSVEKLNVFDYGVGIFSRFKFIDFLFIHAEYGYINRALPILTNDGLDTERAGQDQLLLGLGYTSGFPFGYEIALLYDFLAPEDTTDLPLVLRFGFTYNF